jgi:hypothetical protein
MQRQPYRMDRREDLFGDHSGLLGRGLRGLHTECSGVRGCDRSACLRRGRQRVGRHDLAVLGRLQSGDVRQRSIQYYRSGLSEHCAGLRRWQMSALQPGSDGVRRHHRSPCLQCGR